MRRTFPCAPLRVCKVAPAWKTLQFLVHSDSAPGFIGLISTSQFFSALSHFGGKDPFVFGVFQVLFLSLLCVSGC